MYRDFLFLAQIGALIMEAVQALGMQVETHGVGMTENFAWSAIKDQAGGWKQGVREGGQNGLDAPNSSRVDVTFNEQFTAIRDDGDGRDLADTEERKLFLDLGATTKKGDDSTVGEFGIGKGQMWAIGVTKIVSGRQALIYNVKEKGISRDSVMQVELPEEHAVDGTLVVIYHYDGQVPDRGSREWERYEESLENRFKYTSETLGKDVFVNDTCVSNTDIASAVSGKAQSIVTETEDAFVALYQSKWDDISVYSNGVYVKDIPGEGFGGEVLTKENLSLDISRNDIKEDCELWDDVKEQVDDVKLSLFKNIPDDKRNKKVRKTAAMMMAESDSVMDELKKVPLFETVQGELVSLTSIRRRSRVAFADKDDVYADKVASRGECVLRESDTSAQVLQQSKRTFNCPSVFDIQQVALDEYGVAEGYTVLNDVELSTRQRQRLGVAREMAEALGYSYDIFWGEDEEARAWTDGDEYIVITESLFQSSDRAVWLPDLFWTLLHEASHDESTKGSKTHGRRFKRKLGSEVEKKKPLYRRFAEEVGERGVTDFDIGMTDHAREGIEEVYSTLSSLSEGDEFYKNRDGRCCTVKRARSYEVVFSGPRGGTWVVDTIERDGVPVAERREKGTSQEITHIEEK